MLSEGQGVVTTLPLHSLLGAPEEVLMAAVSHRDSGRTAPETACSQPRCHH